MMKVEIKNSINFPKEFAGINDLLTIARSLFIPNLIQHIEDQETITGGSFPRLEESTIRRKTKSALRSPDMALIDTGRLLRSFQAKKQGKNAVILDIKRDRADIGYYLQVEGVGKKRKQFKFFGISEGMEADAMDYIKKKINDTCKAFNGK